MKLKVFAGVENLKVLSGVEELKAGVKELGHLMVRVGVGVRVLTHSIYETD